MLHLSRHLSSLLAALHMQGSACSAPNEASTKPTPPAAGLISLERVKSVKFQSNRLPLAAQGRTEANHRAIFRASGKKTPDSSGHKVVDKLRTARGWIDRNMVRAHARLTISVQLPLRLPSGALGFQSHWFD